MTPFAARLALPPVHHPRRRLPRASWVFSGLAYMLALGSFFQPAVAQQIVPPVIAAIACAYNTSPPTITTNFFGLVQCDLTGHLLTTPSNTSAAPLYVSTAGTTGLDYSANKPTLPNVGANFAASGPYASYVLIATVPVLVVFAILPCAAGRGCCWPNLRSVAPRPRAGWTRGKRLGRCGRHSRYPPGLPWAEIPFPCRS